LDVLDGGVVAADHPDRLATGALARGVDLGAAVHPDEGEAVGLPAAHVAVVAPGGVDLDPVAGGGRGERRARFRIGAVGPDTQRLPEGGRDANEQRDTDGNAHAAIIAGSRYKDSRPTAAEGGGGLDARISD